jgi:large subunit ribosomal protein L7/L12
MSVNITELGDQIANLKPAEARELRLHMKEKLGIEAPGGDAPPPKKEEAPVVVAQTEFDVWLDATANSAKIAVIKLVREQTGIGLVDAKNYVESGYTQKPLKEQIPKDEAEAVAAKFAAIGGKATLK